MSGSGSSVGVGGHAGGGGSGGPCGACKFLRRKCVSGCVFAPYFDSEQGAVHFAAIHKVFGASNVSKLLMLIPDHKRPDAVGTISYEAQARVRDPIYGCVARIFALQQQVLDLQDELSCLRAQLASLELPPPTPLHPPTSLSPLPPPISISDLPPASGLPLTFDPATLFDPPWQPPWSQQQHEQQRQRQLEFQQLGTTGSSRLAEDTIDSGDLQALARELMERHRSASMHAACSPSISK